MGVGGILHQDEAVSITREGIATNLRKIITSDLCVSTRSVMTAVHNHIGCQRGAQLLHQIFLGHIDSLECVWIAFFVFLADNCKQRRAIIAKE